MRSRFHFHPSADDSVTVSDEPGGRMRWEGLAVEVRGAGGQGHHGQGTLIRSHCHADNSPLYAWVPAKRER